MKKRHYRKIGILVLIFTFIIAMSGISSYAADFSKASIEGLTDIANKGELPEITATAAILIDSATGQILYEKNSHERRYPASTTKIMTALLALENLNPEDTVTVDAESAAVTGSRIFLSEGEYIFVKDLIYSLMVASANDSAVALAKAVSGSVSDFAVMMNDKAKQCGALDTNFNNANGLPDELHYTTAYDLAMITKAAINHYSFREIVATPTYKIAATNKHAERELINGNRMLWDSKPRYEYNGAQVAPKYEGACGVKTGFTEAAGSCLVAMVNREGHELIGVVMGSQRDLHFLDMIKLMDYGYSNYKSVTLCSSEDFKYTVKVKKTEQKKLEAGIREDIRITLPAGAEAKKAHTEAEIEKKYIAPISENQKIGELSVYYDGNLLCKADIAAFQAAPLKEGADIFEIILFILKIIGIALVVLAVTFLLILIALRLKNNKKKKQRRKNRGVYRSDSEIENRSNRAADYLNGGRAEKAHRGKKE